MKKPSLASQEAIVRAKLLSQLILSEERGIKLGNFTLVSPKIVKAEINRRNMHRLKGVFDS